MSEERNCYSFWRTVHRKRDFMQNYPQPTHRQSQSQQRAFFFYSQFPGCGVLSALQPQIKMHLSAKNMPNLILKINENKSTFAKEGNIWYSEATFDIVRVYMLIMPNFDWLFLISASGCAVTVGIQVQSTHDTMIPHCLESWLNNLTLTLILSLEQIRYLTDKG